MRDVLADPGGADAPEIVRTPAARRCPYREHRETRADGDEEPAHEKRIAQTGGIAALPYVDSSAVPKPKVIDPPLALRP